ncbi:hypothetical protein ACV1C8_21090, partial [Aeromonas hydrophila]
AGTHVSTPSGMKSRTLMRSSFDNTFSKTHFLKTPISKTRESQWLSLVLGSLKDVVAMRHPDECYRGAGQPRAHGTPAQAD